MSQIGKFNPKIIFALFLVHFAGDFYMSFIGPLLPALGEKYNFDLFEAGILMAVMRVLAFVVQPTVGYFADRYPTRLFILGGPILCVVITPLMGVAYNYYILLLVVALGAIGSSMFHPPSAAMVHTYSGTRISLSMALFILGGTISFAVGPITASWWATNFGLENLPYTILLGLGMLIFPIMVLPKPETEGMSQNGFFDSLKETLGHAWRPILLVWVIVVVRTFVGQSFSTYIPFLYDAEGYSTMFIGRILAIYTVAGAMSGLAAGHLADKKGHKPVFFISYLLSTPCLLLLTYVGGIWVYVASFLAGFTLLATLPLGVSIAQDLAPKGKSMASSLMMGLAFGVGGMLTPVTGALAEEFGIREVLMVMAFVPVLSLALVFKLPGKKPAA